VKVCEMSPIILMKKAARSCSRLKFGSCRWPARVVFAGLIAAALAVVSVPAACGAGATTESQAAAPGAPRAVGTIKAITEDRITLATDSGAELSITVPDGAHILRVEPGQTDLKSATPVQLSDLQIGDRIFARGQAAADGKSLVATVVILMKKGDIEQKRESEEEQWQHGVGGIVSNIDPSAGTITTSSNGFGGLKTITIHTTNKTDFRRYAPSSIRFADAKPSSIAEIAPGDQVRARGTRSADGGSIDANAVVSGSFRNIAGTISSVDVNSNSIVVMDLIAKSPVTVTFTDGSQLRQLPEPIAQRIAMRLKGAAMGGSAGAAQGDRGNAQNAAAQSGAPNSAGAPVSNRTGPGGPGSARGANGPPDFQQILSRMPATSLAELQKGKAVMIVASHGADPRSVTAITLVAGVEPILEAAPQGASATLLSPWNIGGGAPAGADVP
jgi:hypothetical protein